MSLRDFIRVETRADGKGPYTWPWRCWDTNLAIEVPPYEDGIEEIRGRLFGFSTPQQFDAWMRPTAILEQLEKKHPQVFVVRHFTTRGRTDMAFGLRQTCARRHDLTLRHEIELTDIIAGRHEWSLYAKA